MSEEKKPTIGHQPTFRGGDIAPIVSFDDVPFYGSVYGIGRITLSAQLLASTEAGTITTDYVVTAHLRGSLRAMAALRDAIDKMLLAATPVTGPEN